MFSDLEKKQLLKLNDELSQTITIGLVESGHAHSQVFHEFCDGLTQLAPKIRIAQGGWFFPTATANFNRQ